MTDVAAGGPGGDSPSGPPGPPATAITAIPVRHYGRWVFAVVVVGVLAAFVVAAGKADIDYGVIPDYLTSPVILKGLRNTVVIAVLAQVIGIVLGVAFALMRLSRNPVLATFGSAYIWFFRGTPVLVQLLFWYNLALVLPNVTIGVAGFDLYSKPMVQFMTPFMAALLGLGLNEGAYMAEIVRAGIISVDPGQTEAAQALGMTPGLTMRRIVLPQAMRVIIPPTGNEFISMLKTSSLAAVVTFEEMLRVAQNIYSANLLVIELLLTVSIWYLVLTTIATWGLYYVERHYARGSRDVRTTFLQRLFANLASRPRL